MSNSMNANSNIFKLQNYHHGNLRFALIKAAQSMLEREGAAELSLRKIAKLIGVSAAATYHQFDSKEALLMAVATKGFESIQQRYEETVEKSDRPEKKLNLFIQTYCQIAIQNPHLFHLMFGDILEKHYYPELYESFIKCQQLLEGIIKEFLDEYQILTDQKTIVWRSWSLLHGGINLALNFNSFGQIQSQAEIVDKIQIMLLNDLQDLKKQKNKALYCEVQ